MLYDREIIEHVRDACDIADVISSYMTIKKRGKNYIGLCPFHNEKTGSFSINIKMQYFKCFGCGESGDVFTFIEKIEHIDFKDAIEFLANKASIQLKSKELYEQENDSIRKINKEALLFYNKNLKSQEGREVYDYLIKCGLLEKTIEDFGLGFSGKIIDGLYNFLHNKGFSNKEMINSGLINKNKNMFYDGFQNRIMIPIMDYMGKVVAFSGWRVEVSNKNLRVNIPKETRIYKNKENVYGIQFARKTKSPFFILTNSYISVMMIHQVGYDNAVAYMGNYYSIEQLKIIKRYTNDIVISLESDDVGKSEILDIIPKLINVGLSVRIMDIYPYKKSYDLIICAGVDEFRKRLNEAISSFEYIKRYLSKNYTLWMKINIPDIMEKIIEMISKMEDPFARNNYIKAIVNAYDLDEYMLKSKVIQACNRIIK